jgi:hypothetical protein
MTMNQSQKETEMTTPLSITFPVISVKQKMYTANSHIHAHKKVVKQMDAVNFASIMFARDEACIICSLHISHTPRNQIG